MMNGLALLNGVGYATYYYSRWRSGLDACMTGVLLAVHTFAVGCFFSESYKLAAVSLVIGHAVAIVVVTRGGEAKFEDILASEIELTKLSGGIIAAELGAIWLGKRAITHFNT